MKVWKYNENIAYNFFSRRRHPSIFEEAIVEGPRGHGKNCATSSATPQMTTTAADFFMPVDQKAASTTNGHVWMVHFPGARFRLHQRRFCATKLVKHHFQCFSIWAAFFLHLSRIGLRHSCHVIFKTFALFLANSAQWLLDTVFRHRQRVFGNDYMIMIISN